MKKTSYLALAILGLVLIGMTSCKKSSNNNNNTPSGPSMSASITGNNNFTATAFEGAHSISSGALYLAGYKITNGDTTALLLTVWDSVSVGVTDTTCLWGWAQFGAFSTTVNGPQAPLPWQENNVGGPGTLSITAWDTTKHNISGSFSGTLYQWVAANGTTTEDSLMMTSGKFNMTYTDIP